MAKGGTEDDHFSVGVAKEEVVALIQGLDRAQGETWM